MLNSSRIFAASVTFLGCWFIYAFSASRASKLSDEDFLFGRAGALVILACGVVNLAMSAAMWCRELGSVAGLTAWGFVGLASWILLVLLVGRARHPGPRWQELASHPSSRLSEADTSDLAGRIRTAEGTHLVAIFLFVAAILAFFKQLIEAWNAE